MVAIAQWRYAERNYNYDAFSNCSGPLNSLGNVINNNNHIGNFNPLRYRGYYYDTESELYYLGSRYYDPKMFRFVNADTTEVLTASPMSLTDKNLFSYCDENPVMFMDSSRYIIHYVQGKSLIKSGDLPCNFT
ncbi:MAG: hypothetical protein IJT85_05705 [Ruminococcus sp.]|nr:hypothetical protein [Ruminococcus sp.]